MHGVLAEHLDCHPPREIEPGLLLNEAQSAGGAKPTEPVGGLRLAFLALHRSHLGHATPDVVDAECLEAADEGLAGSAVGAAEPLRCTHDGVLVYSAAVVERERADYLCCRHRVYDVCWLREKLEKRARGWVVVTGVGETTVRRGRGLERILRLQDMTPHF